MGTLRPDTPAYAAVLPSSGPNNTAQPVNCDWFEAAWDNGVLKPIEG